MKKYLVILILGFTALTFSACDSWIDKTINVNPNNPVDAPINLVLPSAEVSLAYVVGGDLSRFTGVWMQHFQGVDRQFEPINRYQQTESDIDNAWQTLYQNTLNSLRIVESKANESNSPHYRGVARILMAATFGHIADVWGDAPFSAALGGNSNLKPKYDKAQDIYAGIQKLLDDGIADCGSATSTLKPTATSDVIYGGNMTKWIKAAHALKARYHWRLGNGASALTSIANAIGAQADDAMLNFSEDPTGENPLSQFMSQRSGYMTVGVKLVELMNAFEDPRRDAYILADKDGKFTADCDPGPLFASSKSPVPIITYAELMFIRAEIKVGQNEDVDAKQSYTNGIKASMAMAGVGDTEATTYLGRADVMPASALTLKHVMEQKFLAMYTQPETFSDWRRTGIPALAAPANAEGSTPRRFLYPISERLYNS
ncbi:MAG: SusD/RagB family nutrient-binding outer membrane lipoprotein, partial [Bacteroidota bacterium]